MKNIISYNPWKHHIVENFLPANSLQQLKDIKFTHDNTVCDGTRDLTQNRYFFTKDKPELTNIVQYFQGKLFELELLCNIDLQNSGLRFELTADDENFYNTPHIDSFDKRITVIVYIKADVDTVGTDLYKTKESPPINIPWKENRALIFQTNKNKWHGFEKKNFYGQRKVLLFNCVNTMNWKATNQLWI